LILGREFDPFNEDLGYRFPRECGKTLESALNGFRDPEGHLFDALFCGFP